MQRPGGDPPPGGFRPPQQFGRPPPPAAGSNAGPGPGTSAIGTSISKRGPQSAIKPPSTPWGTVQSSPTSPATPPIVPFIWGPSTRGAPPMSNGGPMGGSAANGRPPFGQVQQQGQMGRPQTPQSPQLPSISISSAPLSPPQRTSSTGSTGFAPPQAPSFMRPPGGGPQPSNLYPGGHATPSGGLQPPQFAPPGGPSVGSMSQQGGGMQAPNQPQIPHRRSTSRVDERQVPRPMSRGPDGQEIEVFETHRGGKSNPPPSSTSKFFVRDTGNASPRVMRCTMNMIPSAGDIQKSAAIPLALVVAPLAHAQPGDDVVQVVDFGESGPLRCAKCGAYINPHMTWLQAGTIFKCNFCHHNNTTPPHYVENTGPDGRRRDASERPELSKGSVEFRATLPHFMVRPPMPPTHLFLVDVSHTAIATGATAAVCAAIAECLDGLQGGDRACVGVVTFDSTIHFYPVRRGGSQTPSMLVVPDVGDPYTPPPNSVTAPLFQCRPLVERLLQQIPGMFAGTQILDSCGGAAIQACIQALKEGVGGKLHVFMTTLPKAGIHALQMREGNVAAEGKDAKVMLPASKDYSALATQAADAQVSVDLYIMSATFVDLPTLASLCHSTAGQLRHYHPYSPAVHDDQLANDLRWCVCRPQGWEAICRLRCSEGLEVDRYLGGYYQRTTTDLEFPFLSCDHAIAIKLRYTSRLKEDSEVFLQFAVLYSTPEGLRQIRVHTLALPVSNIMGAIFRGADLDAFLGFTTHLLVSQAPGKTSKMCTDAATKACVDMLLSYRKNCAVSSRAGQLILPEPLQLLPLYTLALLKSPAFRPAVRPDMRAFWLSSLSSAPPKTTIALLWPRLIPLHPTIARALSTLPNSANGQQPLSNGGSEAASLVEVPAAVSSLSARVLDQKGVYLLENGVTGVLHFGPEAPPEIIHALLGIPTVPKMEGPQAHLPMPLPLLDNPGSKAVHDIIDLVQRERSSWLALSVARPLSPDLADFHAALVEDRSGAGQSYMEYLCSVHQQVQMQVP
ncbi:hypothetical protein WJX73_000552 [Symbiochloris irregularis]|uniref:Uncharacterized protein n=1 Tax=Symbiochloris irregularis TaxID=706552 RepID=A0AAW1PM21_9CHLO